MVKNRYFIGKIDDFEKQKGWFFGQFIDAKGLELLNSHELEVAWKRNIKIIDESFHIHKKSTEINIVISGWIQVNFDGKIIKIKKDQFYVVYTYTRVKNIKVGKNTEIIVVKFPSIDSDKFLIS